MSTSLYWRGLFEDHIAGIGGTDISASNVGITELFEDPRNEKSPESMEIIRQSSIFVTALPLDGRTTELLRNVSSKPIYSLRGLYQRFANDQQTVFDFIVSEARKA